MSLTVHLALVFHVFIAVAVMVMVCDHGGLWPSWFVAIMVCGRHGLWPSWFVAVMVCGQHGIGPSLSSWHAGCSRCGR